MTEGPGLCYCLANRRAARHLTRLYDRHLSAAGLTSSQFSVLSFLRHRGAMTVVELADALEAERTTLLRALKPLQKDGLVISRRAPAGRALEYALSRAGIRKFEAAAPLWAAAQEDFEKEFGRMRAVALRRDLQRVARSDPNAAAGAD